MKSILNLVLIAALVLSGTAMADNGESKYPLGEPTPLLTGSEDIDVPANIPGFIPRAGELDELVGDTLIVGTTAWDAQHNGSAGRMIGYYPGDDWECYVLYSKLDGNSPSNQRHVHYTKIMDDGNGGLMMVPNPSVSTESNYRSGYTTIAYDWENKIGYPTYHMAQGNGDDFGAYAMIANPFVPNIFNEGLVPEIGDGERIWPHSVFGTTNHIHMVQHLNRADNASEISKPTYFRWEPDPGIGILSPATLDGEQLEFPDVLMNISTDMTTSMDGEKVAMGLCVNRLATLGEDWGDVGEDEQHNNDLYIFESTDGGETWDFDNPYNCTAFLPPRPDMLPDTVSADQDTMRAYTDCSVIYDDEDNLHVAFTAEWFYWYEALIGFSSRIYHHMERADTSVWTQINLQEYDGRMEVWGRTTDRPSLSYDMDTGILWCSMRVVNSGPDGLDGRTLDVWYANADVYVSASPPGEYNGLLWTKPVNVTNTRWTGVDEPTPGESQSETDPTLALRSEGDYLHLFYTKDLDPGTAISATPEGEMTQNPMVYQRISKQTLLDMFEDNAEWVQNYPMHIDSAGFWQDPYNYEWEEQGGFFRPGSVGDASSSLQPHEIELKQNYPNPFNPSTKIAFSLDRPANVTLAVYDVLGREVATLINRGMSAGTHNVLFLAEDLPSGVYFYKLQAGEAEKTRKMVLLK
ncbi:T9SS type A sorting domain-containing protein [bacterium]|nr:T9SS type A sorting domain-containing protein [bacterium]